jgi:hypothetical protein
MHSPVCTSHSSQMVRQLLIGTARQQEEPGLNCWYQAPTRQATLLCR